MTNMYVFYEVANLYDFTRTILYNLSRPQWRVCLGAGIGVDHSYEFIPIVKLVKNTYDLVKKTYTFVWVR